MARITLSAQLEAARTENAQLRAQLAAAHTLADQWEADARRARRELVRRSHAAQTPASQARGLSALAAAYCATHGVRSCTKEQAMSMAGGAA